MVPTTHPSPSLEVCCFVVLSSFSFCSPAIRSRSEDVTTHSVCTNYRLPPRIAPTVGFRTVSCRSSQFHLTPNIFSCAFHFSLKAQVEYQRSLQNAAHFGRGVSSPPIHSATLGACVCYMRSLPFVPAQNNALSFFLVPFPSPLSFCFLLDTCPHVIL